MFKSRASRVFAASIVACSLFAVSAASFAASTVRASNGQEVGRVIGDVNASEQIFAMLQVGDGGVGESAEHIFATAFDTPVASTNGFVEVFLGHEGLTHPYAPYVYFTETACQGNVFVSQAATRPATSLRAAIVGSEAELYLATTDQPALQSVKSRRDNYGCHAFEHSIRAFPLRAVGSLFDRLPPPYSVSTLP